MRTLLVLLPLALAACAPMTPEQRASVAYHLNTYAQQQHEYSMQRAAIAAQTFRPIPRPVPVYAPTYHIQRDYYGNGYIATPRRPY